MHFYFNRASFNHYAGFCCFFIACGRSARLFNTQSEMCIRDRSFRLAAGTLHLHSEFNFTESRVETAWPSLRHSCRSELTRQYDLILLDLMLPEISGYDLLEYIRSLGNIRAAQIQVIIISAKMCIRDT